ncbi:MAG: 2,3-bisphosphoglycerate-independent phosphoglycerate mutase [Acholeplasmatales bacterium]|jgi:2,3-bisphosphoglycerate-independent phosphoglycerate mutase|nr:2,3-bisphosphoglycerate-independent phosphoglycerate mutase [Acholeplasmatales bacterium]
MSKRKLVALIILDGYGVDKKSAGNAIELAKKPYIDSLFKKYPHSLLEASGEFVGLPDGQMGNSEVGHQTLGSGRVTYQSLTRIDVALKNQSFYEVKAFLDAIQYVKEKNSKLHIFGLCSDGGVHSMTTHILALYELAKRHGLVNKTYFHAFMDGRDTPPNSGESYIKKVLDSGLKVASVSGRYYAMDRDNNWDRINLAVDTFVKEGECFDCLEKIKDSYAAGVTDEFITPFRVDNSGIIEENDAIIMANFRPDRAIRLSTLFSYGDLQKYVVEGKAKPNPSIIPANLFYVSMMYYSDTVKGEIAFPLTSLDNLYGDIISRNNLKQLRIAETEKYAHVTFFFDGGKDKDIEGSTRVLINSPKVATYDLQPEMSAYEVARRASEEILTNNYDTVILNFANPDMVGHTGIIPAVVKAIETIDVCLKTVVDAVLKVNGTAIIIADHGNAEKMIDENGFPMTAHTTNKVPVIITDSSLSIRDGGALYDIAPTMLTMLSLDIPKEMTGKSLIKK